MYNPENIEEEEYYEDMEDHLEEEEVEDYEEDLKMGNLLDELCQTFDLDEEGSLTKEQINEIFKIFKFPQEELRVFDFNSEKEKRIDYETLKKGLRYLFKNNKGINLLDFSFKLFESEKEKEFIDFESLKQSSGKYGLKDLEDKDIKGMLNLWNKNNNNKLSKSEFLQIIKNYDFFDV
eukprot:TRINITY_DN1860_c0_g1_i2.p1 TRINITY_DN1860_c0_g1~~TRINITY_DN1860_c0_g1_i2.p1  ORF type:complete len:178 (-),score=74.02 TRINITY_DN1860_c0_g1_i2:10-543(-)